MTAIGEAAARHSTERLSR